jgi:hypothetical protein
MILKGFREFINESQSGATYADLKLLLELGMVDDIQDDMHRGFKTGTISHDELLDWVTPICDKYSIKDWTLNDEGLVDVDRYVNLSSQKLTRLPLRFSKVIGDFYCYNNQLTSLEGSPSSVGGDFYCNGNYLTTLEGAPKWVGGDFSCRNNQLTTLEGAPQEVGRNFRCNDNYLTTLEGAPKQVGGSFYCYRNQLITLEGIGEVGCQIDSDIK